MEERRDHQIVKSKHLNWPKGHSVMAKNEQTGDKAGKSASKVLRDGRTGKDSKIAAGSALTQRPNKPKPKK